MTGSPRALMPDYLRLVALFGIVVVNVQFIAFSALGSFADPGGETLRDAITLWLVNGLALLKTYGLFSFMFGVGLGLLMRSAARRALPFGRLYRNRMIGLAFLGIAHGCLFFPGDILTIYAVTGSILYLFRDWPVRRLVRVGAALLVLHRLCRLGRRRQRLHAGAIGHALGQIRIHVLQVAGHGVPSRTPARSSCWRWSVSRRRTSV